MSQFRNWYFHGRKLAIIYIKIKIYCTFGRYYKKNNMNKIGEVLRERGLKQKWLAEQLGMSTVTICTFVNNRRQPKTKDIVRMCEILNVELNQLIEIKKK
jgi:DNA-binding Xre family transcriptional regulator